MTSSNNSAVKIALTRDLGLFDITMIGVGAMIGATGEQLFEQRLFGSIPEQVARETTKTVIMTKRYWRLKSLLGKVPRRPSGRLVLEDE